MRTNNRPRLASRLIGGLTAAATLALSLLVPSTMASAATFTATTLSPTSVAGTSATIQGSALPPNTTDTAYTYFCEVAGTGLVPGTSYPSGTVCNLDHTVITGASSAVSISYGLTGLTAGTLYSYDVEAYDSTTATYAYGSVVEFTTPAAPAASTSAATAVTGTSATINGSATANNNSGPAASSFFCVGATSAVTSTDGSTCSNGTLTAASAPSPTGSSATSESANLTGLTAGSTTYYVLVVSNTDTFTVSSSTSFTTSAAPAASTSAPISVTGTTAIMEGSATANNNSGPAASAFFCVGSATGVTSTDGSTCSTANKVTANVASPTGSSATPEAGSLTGLTSGSTYYYVLVVANADTFTVSTETSFTTPVPPGATTSAATSVTGTTATMNGTATANNNAGPAGSAFFCEGTTSGVTSTDGSTCSTGTKYAATPGSPSGSSGTPETGSLTGLSAGSTYYYALVVANSDTFTVGSAVSFTTPAPPASSTSAATSVAGTTATLHGSATANNNSGPAASAFFCLSTSSSVTSTNGTSCSTGTMESASAPSPTGSGATTEASSVTGLSRGTTYYFVLVVANSDTFTVSSSSSFTTPDYPGAAIEPATGVTASTATLNGVTTANNYSGSAASSFFCYGTSSAVWSYNGTSCSNGTYVAASPFSATGESGTPESASLTGLTKGTTYYVILVVLNGAGYTVSDTGEFTTWTNPSAPTALSVTAGAAWVTATWGAPVSDGGTPVTSYTCTLMYGFNSPTTFTVTTTGTTCTFSGLPAGSTWGVAVFAVNAVGPSTPVIGFATLPGPPPLPSHKPVIIHLVCVRGHHVRHVSGVHPHCPKGWHIRL